VLKSPRSGLKTRSVVPFGQAFINMRDEPKANTLQRKQTHSQLFP